MPRLSLWHQNKTNDYRFIDRQIREMYTIGGIDIYVHKYLGVITASGETMDATLPHYDEENPLFIEDLLLLENRNRDYDENVYELRGVFNVNPVDWNMTQVGMFLQQDVLFVTFHYNDMIDYFGRKLMNGDVLEIPNLKDYNPLNPNIPKALPKFYVITDADFASEGFSVTWYPHLWRIKAIPMVGSQEYKDILNDYMDQLGDINGTDGQGNGSDTFAEWMSTCTKNHEINEAIVEQAEAEIPLSGYEVKGYYVLPPDPTYVNTTITAEDSSTTNIENDTYLPLSDGYYVGYLTGDSLPPNGSNVSVGASFPESPLQGDYALRTDYSPNRLFQYNGNMWIKIEDNVRTDLTPGEENKTQRSRFVNNTETVQTNDRGEVPSRQSLSDLLKPESDN